MRSILALSERAAPHCQDVQGSFTAQLSQPCCTTAPSEPQVTTLSAA
jgi:hypothetical protein